MTYPYICLFNKSRKVWKLQKARPEIFDTKKKMDKCYFSIFSIELCKNTLDNNRDNSLSN